MPLPFTNVWDDTFPADTALVSQGAANLRQLRVDIQQRMAAISGADAAKPNFSADAQPNNWLGILYFATDTGRIYRFNPPATWLDVTSSFGGGGGGSAVIARDTVGRSLGGSTAETTIFTTTIPILQPNSILRITAVALLQAITVLSTIRWRLNGTQVLGWQYGPGSPAGLVAGYNWFSTVYMANRNLVNQQMWSNQMVMAAGTGVGWTLGPLQTTIDTSAETTLTLSVQDVQGGNTQDFHLWMVELL